MKTALIEKNKMLNGFLLFLSESEALKFVQYLRNTDRLKYFTFQYTASNNNSIDFTVSKLYNIDYVISEVKKALIEANFNLLGD